MVHLRLFGCLVCCFVACSVQSSGGERGGLRHQIANIPLAFEQAEGGSAFVARGAGYAMRISATEVTMMAGNGQEVVAMRLVGASAAARGDLIEPLPGHSNYFIGNDSSRWRRDVRHHRRVRYQDVYPGTSARNVLK